MATEYKRLDNPNSPIPNCRLLINDKKNLFIAEKKSSKFIKEKKINKDQVIDTKKF